MSSQQDTAAAKSSYLDDAAHWVSRNKLKAIGGLWASSLFGSMAYQWTRPIPTSLKIIHSRVYAQAFTLGALGVAALADLYDKHHTTQQEVAALKEKVHGTR